MKHPSHSCGRPDKHWIAIYHHSCTCKKIPPLIIGICDVAGADDCQSKVGEKQYNKSKDCESHIFVYFHGSSISQDDTCTFSDKYTCAQPLVMGVG